MNQEDTETMLASERKQKKHWHFKPCKIANNCWLTWNFYLSLFRRRSQVQTRRMIQAQLPPHPLEVALVESTGTEKEMKLSQATSGQVQIGDQGKIAYRTKAWKLTSRVLLWFKLKRATYLFPRSPAYFDHNTMVWSKLCSKIRYYWNTSNGCPCI